MTYTSTLIGYPYIGDDREWKKALEAFWRQERTEEDFQATLKSIRLSRIEKQLQSGIDMVTVGDFTLYDRMLDTALMFGLVPKRFNWQGGRVDLHTYYSVARGNPSAVASEMTKWFNTNYHYIVPEYEGQPLQLTENKVLADFLEAKEAFGIIAKPTLIGPYTFYKLTKGYNKLTQVEYLVALLPLYAQIIQELVDAGAQWIQLEEPSLVTTLDSAERKLVQEIYTQLATTVPAAKLMLQTYFEALCSYETLITLPVQGFGLDFVHGYKGNMESLRQFGFPQDKVLAIGIVNGRDIWRSNLAEANATIQAIEKLSDAKELWIQPSSSLQHVPISTSLEKKLDPILKQALAFADEKIVEIIELTKYRKNQDGTLRHNFSASMKAIEALKNHSIRQNKMIQQAAQSLLTEDFERHSDFNQRQKIQQQALGLPLFPTTTIGSFPQSDEVKRNRNAWRKKQLSNEDYEAFIELETKRWIHLQEDLDMDVLVHGEFERTDMVEYFGEKLTGFAFTEKAWVVSYGSRCVKPPIIYGDVAWSSAITVKESAYAQSLTKRFVKGMLTGPVTILNWSFVRDDISRKDVAYQIALALRKEVGALETAGISIIQVDEPALREGLPLRKEEWGTYLDWAVNAFKLATSSVEDETQIHTHMCYCEFNDFIEPISALDADVISIETSRSHGELISSLQVNPYTKGIGLGVYDIHSPRVPSEGEMLAIMRDSLQVLDKHQFWVNPDCGLKTRKEPETIAALANMVGATKILRQEVKESISR
ncbi:MULTISPECIES: 5-methyltetrahydropteroyltriglutamate--homocysteine S-methyltransferase [Lysinibacillus]|uniref:5-methyltetrahydropteroyltriglutamate-- homocysteine S-methyltransferase n=1 Tax=Lysinibacillus TaxID=400634 RepID=UPI00055BD399|nr:MULTISPECIES: 5-methyltetrahydropteroyltriglutamate--homocysteine S-methyltransferase [Lysinibacillus]AJK87771.1 5-methyltetrahydropteroyltriglutamate--homocysteine methyltransferase [Lysinibacillus fusiformis]KHK49090.1 5-methyltetrahydropteroyltriglutamate--homocysteine methyltransferase [Lysinibacillus sp. A1]MCT6929162.1 5-methyltetrahydropteroyltriglutamate--homocysteine S-methyltransferase [Lysinibacillus fusiformis]MCT6931937.1 5-methyltetrahydropteroyltriglutamate--homocysteine S-met